MSLALNNYLNSADQITRQTQNIIMTSIIPKHYTHSINKAR